ncbi:hypothetical protein [[Flexibacter] sp. ATCC 35208]|uniref:hypothetical protein n=1 Tax=[Flexibacter] sp. ATCC 35208 TaxID=1936242 RepID=UPI0009CEB9BD|nr:hypothetical protein [[Flexibacter] sp. ATCC 35208]OMP80024.1 hypothetical protein BW716_05900 [[Flexibacter] sp. ATCC 35208]
MPIELNEIGDPNKAQLFIEGKPFDLEHQTGLMYPQGAIQNAISLKNIKSVEGYFPLIYNHKIDSLRPGVLTETIYEHEIKLPTILSLGPIKDNEVLNNINRDSFENDLGFVVVNETIRNRLLGKMPEIDIMGDKYILNMRDEMLVSTKDFQKQFSFKEFYRDDELGIVQGWYDFKKKEIENIEQEYITHTPKNLYLVELPVWHKMDPIGAARRHYQIGQLEVLNDTEYINSFMMEPNPVAKSTHVSKTDLAKTIAKNRKARKLPPEKKVQVAKPASAKKGKKM